MIAFFTILGKIGDLAKLVHLFDQIKRVAPEGVDVYETLMRNARLVHGELIDGVINNDDYEAMAVTAEQLGKELSDVFRSLKSNMQSHRTAPNR